MSDPELESLLEYLKRSRGFDFTGYKRASLTRRMEKRLRAVQASDYAAYREYVESHAAEFEKLFDTILINVTAFFRNEDAWQFLRSEVVPQILAQKGPTEPIRVWSAGSASGQEAYSLAIIFAEALAAEEFRERVKIYATDIDERALMAGRGATYSVNDVSSLPPEIVERHFEQSGSRYVVRKDLRGSVVFGRNDLTRDAPISRVDLLACRNALMYFDAPTQGRILSGFCSAVNEGGYLFLGRAESMLTQANTFVPVDLKRRIFRRVGRGTTGRRGPARTTVEVTPLHAELEPWEPQTAHEELQSTKEELDTTNEELRSTVEALEATNEQLQSTNEDLETMNAELQSTNAALRSMNDELRMRSEELNQVTCFLERVSSTSGSPSAS